MGAFGGAAKTPLLIGIAAVCTVLAAALAIRSPLLVLLAVSGLLGLAIFTSRPKLGIVAVLTSICLVPCWVGVDMFGFIPAASVGCILALLALLKGARWTPSGADAAVVVLLISAGLGVAAGTSNASFWVSMISQWLVAYLVGRFVVEKAGMEFTKVTLSGFFSVVGLLAVVERVAGWHPFGDIGPANQLHAIWGSIQERGGIPRSEWAFGHSIALGGSLALAIPFLVTANIRGRSKALGLLLIGGGIATTLSRGPMLAAGLSLALTLMAFRSFGPKQKFGLGVLTAALGIATLVNFTSVASDAGDEITNSSSYRATLLNELLPSIQLIGRASSAVEGGAGAVEYGGFGSIDNTFLAIGLGYGWIAAAAMTLPFLVIGWRFLRKRATVAEVALLGQLPVLATVAMITQFQILVWLVAGMAAASVIATKPRKESVGKLPHHADGLRLGRRKQRLAQDPGVVVVD